LINPKITQATAQMMTDVMSTIPIHLPTLADFDTGLVIAISLPFLVTQVSLLFRIAMGPVWENLTLASWRNVATAIPAHNLLVIDQHRDSRDNKQGYGHCSL
jgi:hypothetical protein